MKKDYTKLKLMARKMLTKYGKEIVFTMPSLKRGAYNPATSLNVGIADITCTGVGVKLAFTTAEKANKSILENDQKIIFESDDTLEVGMVTTIDGIEYLVVDPAPLCPADLTVIYFAQVRA
jgi:hypothetical protein